MFYKYELNEITSENIDDPHLTINEFSLSAGLKDIFCVQILNRVR